MIVNQTSLNVTAIEDCAKLCSIYSEFKCQSFDTCVNDDHNISCFLYEMNMITKLKHNNHLQYIDDDKCNHYSSKFHNYYHYYY